MTRSSNYQSKIESVSDTWSVYIIYNEKKSKVFVGTTRDFKDRLKKHNTLETEVWFPVFAITGFHNNKEALDFEANVRALARKREFTEYATLYPGQCPPLVLKRVLAIRCLLCEYDFCWRAPRGKKRRYVLHWGSFMVRDQRQTETLKNCPWSRIGRFVKHMELDLSEDCPPASEIDSSNVSDTSTPEHISIRKRKAVDEDVDSTDQEETDRNVKVTKCDSEDS
ncbi:19274_t:CDS:2 [Funneliformis geosporum]|uniref:16046_t:CDS:1 n=1 Tax=Funneliformis geosporum TaxID=1117311 RepID=A0A9W4WRK1_9GLOM|nr:19274_t:CDS:2 [Funneliformis geosporum]CAI2181080.1 16046_t:CDS:2 [Funneliformis geosporum]